MNWYKRSLKKFKRIIRKNPKITREEWNEFASQNCYFSSMTLEAHHEGIYDFESLKNLYLRPFIHFFIDQ